MDAIIVHLINNNDDITLTLFLQRFQKLKALKRVMPASKQAFVRDVTQYFPGVDDLANLLEPLFGASYEDVAAALSARQAEGADDTAEQLNSASASEEGSTGAEKTAAHSSEDAQPAQPEHEDQTESQSESPSPKEAQPMAQEQVSQLSDGDVMASEAKQEVSMAVDGSTMATDEGSAEGAENHGEAQAEGEAANTSENAAAAGVVTDSVELSTPTKVTGAQAECRRDEGMSHCIVTPYKTYTIWVGDLPPNVTDEAIKEAFAGLGEIAKVWHCNDKSNERAFGFVHFAKRDAQKAALRRDYVAPQIMGRQCRIGPSTEKVTLHIGNLPEQATTDMVLEKLGEWIGPENVAVVELKTTNQKCRGFGFLQLVDQHTTTDSLRRLNSTPRTLLGRQLTFSIAEPDDDPEQQQIKTVYMCNLDSAVSEEELTAACSDYGNVVKVTLCKDQSTGLPRGYCFVEFEKRAEALKAVAALHNTQLGCKLVSASIAKPKGVKVGQGQGRDPRARALFSPAGYRPPGGYGMAPPASRYPPSPYGAYRGGLAGYGQSYSGYGQPYSAYGQSSAAYGQSYGGYGNAYRGYNPPMSAYGQAAPTTPRAPNMTTPYGAGQRRPGSAQRYQPY